jgi:hypothetical protein
VAGDFFHVPKPGEELLKWLIDLMKEYSITTILCPGQHDLPGHNLDQIPSSGIGVLESTGLINIISKSFGPMTFRDWAIWGCAYGEEPDKSMVDTTRKNLLLWHRMIIQEPLWPGQVADKSTAVLRKHLQFSIVCTGDNHQSFVVSPSSDLDGNNRLLINPGSMMRQTAAQVNHKPCVFKYEHGSLEQIFLPIDDNVLDLTELEQTKERDSRISAFVERLNTQHEIGLDFQKNLELHLQTNDVKSEVKKIIWECVE